MALAATVLAGASGCQTSGTGGERFFIPNIFQSETERPLADVPVPRGSRLQHRGSYIFDNNYRVALLRYSSGQSKGKLESFFESQMPVSGWSSTGVSGESTRVLEYTKELERCRITITRSSGVSRIEIDVAPKG